MEEENELQKAQIENLSKGSPAGKNAIDMELYSPIRQSQEIPSELLGEKVFYLTEIVKFIKSENARFKGEKLYDCVHSLLHHVASS
jgi:hypothetical protein